MRALLLIAFLLAPSTPASTIDGRVLAEGAPLPGCTVTLSAGDAKREKICDAEGRYSFAAVAPGSYTMTFALDGFKNETRDVMVDGATTVDDVELSIDGEIVISCSLSYSECSTSEPATPFDRPICAEWELNTALIESMKIGDASANDLLRQRYRRTFTYFERHRIAEAFLGRVVDDREYWNELSTRVTEAIRFAYRDGEATQEYIEWCTLRDVDPEEYRWMTLGAISRIAGDRRARPLLLEALASKDLDVTLGAFFTVLGDGSYLPEIEKALERFPEKAETLALNLAWFRSDAADRIAMKFISDGGREDYAEERHRAECANIPCDP